MELKSYKSSNAKYRRTRSSVDANSINRSQICNISQINLITRNNSSNMCNNTANQTTANKHCVVYYNHIPKNKRKTNTSFVACSLYKQHQHLHNMMMYNNKPHSLLPIKLQLSKVKIHFLHSKDVSAYNKRLNEINCMSNSLIREKMRSYYTKNELNLLPLLLPLKAVNNINHNYK